MKKLYFLLLLLTTYTGFAFSPPAINPPANLTVCDSYPADLTVTIPSMLSPLNPSLYTTTFHLSQADADADANQIANPNAFIVGNSTQVFARVEDNANPTDFSTTNFWVYLQPLTTGTIMTASGTQCGNAVFTFHVSNPIGLTTFSYSVNGGAQQNISTTDASPYDVTVSYGDASNSYDIVLNSIYGWGGNPCNQVVGGFVHIETIPLPNVGEPINIIKDQPVVAGNNAQFDLLENYTPLMNGQSNLNVLYFTTQADVEAGTNPINPLLYPAYDSVSGTRLWARVEDQATGCFVIKSFFLYVRHPDADYVFIPDPNLKLRLVLAGTNVDTIFVAQDLGHNYCVIDVNGDGEIQYTEAANISLLNAGSGDIIDMTGLEAFFNMKYLNIGYNYNLTTVDLSAMPLLETLSATHCNLNALSIANNHNLTDLSCEYNNLSALDMSPAPLVTILRCQNNHLTSLNLTGLTVLNDLVCSDNQITSLNTADLHSMLTFNVAANQLTSLDVSAMTLVQQLICEHNQIDSLDTAGCTALTNLRCAYNQMTYLDVSESLALNNLDCSVNTLLTLDLSHNAALCNLNCYANITMTWLNIKNGVDSCYTNFNVMFINNVLQQFCCDDNEVAYFKNYFLTHQGIDVNVNSYCSFTPGGQYNTISPNAQYDANSNGCDVSDATFPNVRFNIFDQTNSGAAFTGVNGTAQFFTQAGSFDITPAIENPSWFTVSPSTVNIPFANTNNNTATPNFCIAPTGTHPDLEIVIAPITNARPGFNAEYKIVIRNKGNVIMTQLNGINLAYNANQLDFLFATDTPSLVGTGSLSWSFTNLSPFESRTIYVTMHVHTPGDANPVMNGDILTFNTTVNPIAGDENPSDNTFQFNQTVVGSFDPNEIVCLEGNVVSPIEIGNYLHYEINFENTGTAPAENIVVREVIDTNQFDISSLQLLNSSASVTTRITGNTIEFIFPSINLHSGGHGNILLKIRSNDDLVAGDIVSKKANIYFDYNFPVETLPEDTLFQSLSNPDVDADASISVYPNPTNGNINIGCDTTIKSVQLYDMQGRLLQTSMVNQNQANIDLSNQSGGVYFLKIISEKGIGVKKIVRN